MLLLILYFEKALNGQIHSLLDSHQTPKKFFKENFSFTPLRGLPPHAVVYYNFITKFVLSKVCLGTRNAYPFNEDDDLLPDNYNHNKTQKLLDVHKSIFKSQLFRCCWILAVAEIIDYPLRKKH